MRIYHVATLADWRQAQETGTYTTSTYGRTLEDVGFIHAARHDQVPGIRDVLYADVTEPLVVLEVETDRLEVEVRDEEVDGDVFPHVYGPIPTSAVVAWRPARLPPIELSRRVPAPPPPPLTLAFRGVALVLVAGALVAFGCAVGAQVATDDGRMPVGISYVLWSLMGVLAAPALVAFAWGEWTRSTSTPPD